MRWIVDDSPVRLREPALYASEGESNGKLDYGVTWINGVGLKPFLHGQQRLNLSWRADEGGN
jgi:hypothetical protein